MRRSIWILARKRSQGSRTRKIGLGDCEESVVVLEVFIYTNFILLEQFALGWVQKHISAFGGDTTKVITYVIIFLQPFEC
jgi:hypothetical protein